MARAVFQALMTTRRQGPGFLCTDSCCVPARSLDGHIGSSAHQLLTLFSQFPGDTHVAGDDTQS